MKKIIIITIISLLTIPMFSQGIVNPKIEKLYNQLEFGAKFYNGMSKMKYNEKWMKEANQEMYLQGRMEEYKWGIKQKTYERDMLEIKLKLYDIWQDFIGEYYLINGRDNDVKYDSKNFPNYPISDELEEELTKAGNWYLKINRAKN